MSSDNLVQCYNKGCGQKFDPDKNLSDACRYHPGAPVFHDAYKGWSCCNKKSTDFTVFLNYPGCTTGSHSNEKPAEPEKPTLDPSLQNKEVITCKAPLPAANPVRPPSEEPKCKLKETIGQSAKQALEKLMNDLSVSADKESGDSNAEIKVGTSCKNNGCKACYATEESNLERCRFHPGFPVFHEGMKFWSCCQKKTSDFDNFLDQEGCETGHHLWVKKQVEGEVVSCRFDWHQTASFVTISVFSKTPVPEKCHIVANQVAIDINIVFEGGKKRFERNIELCHPIDLEKSNVKFLGTKVEINMKKADSFSWATLDHKKQPEQNAEDGN